MNRKAFVTLIEKYFPATGYLRTGQIGFDHIAKDYTGGGTTCGFLPPWLWWRSGCRDAALLNRYEPDTPFIYKDGKNMSVMSGHPAFVRVDGSSKNNQAFLDGTIYPDAGDAIMIHSTADEKGNAHEHVFVALDWGTWASGTKGTWRICETGQKDGGVEAGHITTRGVEYKNGKWYVGDRWILGWLDISKVTSFGAAPQEILAPYSQRTVPGPPYNVGGSVWKVTSSSGGTVWYYMFEKGHRVFYSNGNQPTSIRAGGCWIPDGSQILVTWEGGGTEKMWPKDAKNATGHDGAHNWTAVKIASSSSLLKSFHSGSGNAMGPTV